MSGGHFDYIQHRIHDAADEVARLSESYSENKVDEWGSMQTALSRETILRFRECEAVLRKASIMLQRVDWLVSGDDGEESFHRRLNRELQELQTQVDGMQQ